jgi:hypothetical protein
VVKLATEPGGLKLHLALAPAPLDLHRGSHADPDHNVCRPGVRPRQIGFLDR